MEVVLQAQFKNGLLYRAVQKLGNQSRLAEYLGAAPQQVGKWLNFKDVPRFRKPHSAQHAAVYEKWDCLLRDLVGYGLEEIFPPELEQNKEEIRKAARLELIREMPIERLVEMGAVPQLPSSPFETINQHETKQLLLTALEGLSEREQDVIKMRYGLDGSGKEHSLDEVGRWLGVTRERIRQVEAKALRRLRHPSHTRILKQQLVKQCRTNY